MKGGVIQDTSIIRLTTITRQKKTITTRMIRINQDKKLTNMIQKKTFINIMIKIRHEEDTDECDAKEKNIMI